MFVPDSLSLNEMRRKPVSSDMLQNSFRFLHTGKVSKKLFNTLGLRRRFAMMYVMEIKNDNELFLKLKDGDESAFEALFHKYYASLCLFSFGFLHDKDAAEEVVQDIFLKMWSLRRQLLIGTSVRNYLFYSVRNQSLNRLQHERVEKRYIRQIQSERAEEQDPAQCYMEVELVKKIEDAVAALPEKRREIFRLSREEGLKYQEIAQRLNISVKTVETHMGLALKQLRQMLKPYDNLH